MSHGAKMTSVILPTELIRECFARLKLSELHRLRQLDDEWLSEILAGDDFWRLKFFADYGRITYDGCWKTLYYKENSVWVYGAAYHPGLSYPEWNGKHATEPMEIGVNAIEVATSDLRTIYRTADNEVYLFGVCDRNKDRDNGWTSDVTAPVLICRTEQISLGHDDIVYTNEAGHIISHNEPSRVSKHVNVRKIVVGNLLRFIIDRRNVLWAKCFNTHGELILRQQNTGAEISTGFNNVRTVACGTYHTVVLDWYHNVWVCGANRDGQLGIPGYDKNELTLIQGIQAKQIACGNYTTAIIDLNDEVLATGLDYGDTFKPIGLKAKQIACGHRHMAAIDLDNYLWVWGVPLQPDVYDINVKYNHTPVNLGVKAKQVSCGYHLTVWLSTVF
jgi:hypothetical protein